MTAISARVGDEASRRRILVALAGMAVVATAFVIGALGAQQPVIVLGGIFLLVAAGASFARPDAAVYIVVAVLYSNAAAIAVDFHGLPYFVALAFPLPLVLPLAYRLILRRETVTVTSAFPLVFVLAIIELLSTAASRDIKTSLNLFVVFAFGGAVLYFLLMNVVRSFEVLRRAVWTILFVAAAMGALSFYQVMTGTYDSNFGGFGQVNLPGVDTQFAVSAVAAGAPRLAGPVGEVNRYGQVMLVLLPIGALMAYGEKRLRYKLVGAALTTLILAGMAATGSRGAAVGLAVVVIAAVFFRYVRIVHVVVVGVAIALTLFAFPRYTERLVDLQAVFNLDAAPGSLTAQGDVSNLRGRFTETLAALLVFTDHPIVGVGPGMFPYYYQQYAQRVAAESVDTRVDIGNRQAHNLYMDVAAETGILGITCFMGIVLITMRDLRRARRRWLVDRPEIAHLATGFYLGILGYLASGMFLHLSYERYFWLLVALGGIAAHLALRMPREAIRGDSDRARGDLAPPNGGGNRQAVWRSDSPSADPAPGAA